MSKILFVCYKNKAVPAYAQSRLKIIEGEILPDNIVPNDLDMVIEDGVISCIFNPMNLDQRKNKSICLGQTTVNWWAKDLGSTVLDGSYAIIRNDDVSVELETDSVASRAIFYFVDDEKIIASNSQLAILYFLSSFEFNEEVIPWMLTTGTLGPYLSWDSRIKSLKPQSKLILEKKNWNIKIETESIIFKKNKMSSEKKERHLNNLSNEIDKSTGALPLHKKLLLPLSGGYDSRGILLSLENNKKKISTITWGSAKAITDKNNDAYIAKKLAEHYKTKHEYVYTDDSTIDLKIVIERFLINSEGRIDHIGAYMDGFKIWKDIFENNYAAIVRGDEGFGWVPVYTEQQARTSVGLHLMTDFNQFNNLAYKQILPTEYIRKVNESIQEWCDRLYHTFRLPMVLGALNETKSAYVEVFNPLLSYSILHLMRGMPDHLRSNKNLFRLYVENLTPKIPFAKKGANIDLKVHLKNPEIVSYFIKIINDNKSELIDKQFVEEIIKMSKRNQENNFKSIAVEKIKKILPPFLKFYLKGRIKIDALSVIDNNLLLFRIFIIYRMHQKINSKINWINAKEEK